LLITDSPAKFIANYEDCGLENFILMSRRLWRAAQGFDEGDDYQEMYAMFLAKMTMMIPGSVRQFLPIVILTNNDHVIRDCPVADQDIPRVMEDIVCNGHHDDPLGWSSDNWGCHHQELEHLRF
jgi:hypothetical protein